MPYIEMKDRNLSNQKVATPGDLNFVLFSYLVRTWNKYPRYDTIHCFNRDFVQDPKKNKLLQDFESRYASIFTVADIRAAAACAYDEFMRRIGNNYEDRKIALNGDVEGVQDALDHIAQLSAQPVEETKVTVLSDTPAIPVETTKTEVK